MPNAEAVQTNVPAILAPGLGALDRVRWLTNKVTAELTEDQAFARPCPGGNHTLWVLGHIATTDDFFLTTLGGRVPGVPESWNGLFGMNSEVSDDRSKYPPLAEVRAKFEEHRAAVKAWLCSLSEEELAASIEGDLAMFAATYAELASSLAFHEGFHAGQASTARRALGMAPLF